MDGFSDGVEGREVREPGRRGPEEFGHLVVVVVLELELIALVLDQVLGAVMWPVRRVDGVTGRGSRGGAAGPRDGGGVMVIVVADGPVAHVLALDHVDRHRRSTTRVLRYPVVVYGARVYRLLSFLVHQRLMVLQGTSAPQVLFAVHGGRRVRRLLLIVVAVLAGRVLGVRVRTDLALDHFATIVRLIVLLLLLLLLLLLDRRGRDPFLGLTVGCTREKRDNRYRDDQRRRPLLRSTTAMGFRPARRLGGTRHLVSISLQKKHNNT